MGKQDTYAMREDAEKLTAIKFDKEDEPVDTYYITKLGQGASICTCWAGGRWCRHKQMIDIFRKAEAMNTGRRYSFDKKKWFAAPKVEEL